MHGFNGMYWGMGFGWIIGIAILVLLVWVIFKTANSDTNPSPKENKSALDVLQERYARGEIEKEEYEEKKKSIS